MAPSRHVIVAGAGIAGLTTAMTLSRAGFRATVLEQAPKLEETGAGIQLSPNATRILFELGLRERLEPHVVRPQMIRVMSGGSGREIARIPLGDLAERRYGAPFWVIHRGDLQAALEGGARGMIDIDIKLDHRFDDFATHANGITVQAFHGKQLVDERGAVLIGADGIWSAVGDKLKNHRKPVFAHRTAWRALVPADSVPDHIRAPAVHLFLGMDAHLVAYPVKAGALINLVGIVNDTWSEAGWNAPGERTEILRHFARFTWHESVRELIGVPQRWLKWALFDNASPFAGGAGAVTLVGDAAHPMLPFLAQGAGMAIEDAAVLAEKLKEHAEHPAAGLRAYERLRRARTARVQRTARQQGSIYGRSGPEAFARNLVMRMLGGERLLKRYDWVYNWRRDQGAV